VLPVSEGLEFDPQRILDRASTDDREKYHELMRHDPIAGDVFLRAVALVQRTTAEVDVADPD
jgi:hypothetical protein